MTNSISSLPAFPNLPQPSSASSPDNGDSDFGSVLSSAINQVEQLHSGAAQQVTDLLKGDRSDVQNVMIAVEKADVAFQLMMQVRNKIVNAYQEISRMQF
jgi:flagellar hook-basal body complex protein FliE